MFYNVLCGLMSARDSYKLLFSYFSLSGLPLDVRKGQLQIPFLVIFSVCFVSWCPQGTATNFFSRDFLCPVCLLMSARDSHKLLFSWFSLSGLSLDVRKGQPQIPFLGNFSVCFALQSPKRTTTNIISRRFSVRHAFRALKKWPWVSRQDPWLTFFSGLVPSLLTLKMSRWETSPTTHL